MSNSRFNILDKVQILPIVLCLISMCACSVLLDYEECKTGSDCKKAGTICQDGHCIKDDTKTSDTNNQNTDTSDTASTDAMDASDILLNEDCTQIYGVSPKEALETETILLASVLPYTGDLSAFGPKIGQGVELAIDEINQAGGILGHNVGVLFCDSATDAEVAKRALTHIISLEKIPAVVGPAASSIVIDAYTNITKDANLVMVSPSATSTQIAEYQDSGLLWRTVASNATQGDAIARYLLEEGFKQIAIINRNDVFGNGLRDEIAETLCAAFPCGDSGRYYFGIYDEDSISTQQSQIAIDLEEFNPEITVLISYFEDGVSFLELTSQLSDSQFFLSDGMRTEELLSANLPEGLFCQTLGTQAASQSDKNFKSFSLRFTSKYDEVGAYSANAYDAIYMIAYSIAATDAEAPSGFNVATGMARLNAGDVVNAGTSFWKNTTQLLASNPSITINYEGASGSLDFDEQGEIISDIEAWSFDMDEKKVISLGTMYTHDGQFYDVVKGNYAGQGGVCDESSGYKDCENIADCNEGDFCDLTLDPPRCFTPPYGQGETCTTTGDCELYEADYCEAIFTRTCLKQGCDTELNNCSLGYHCCEFSGLGLPPLCVDETQSGGVCRTGVECTNHDECNEGEYCDLTLEPANCVIKPAGEGQKCSEAADCAGFQADYCENIITSTCLMQGCDKDANNCSKGRKCCDFAWLGLPSLCIDLSFAANGGCACSTTGDCPSGEHCDDTLETPTCLPLETDSSTDPDAGITPEKDTSSTD